MECGLDNGSGLLQFGIGGDIPDKSEIGLCIIGFHMYIWEFK